MKLIGGLMLLALLGCQTEVYVSEKCTDEEMDLVHTAVDRINAHFDDVNLVIAGWTWTDREELADERRIFCVHDTEDWIQGPNGTTVMGWERNDTVVVYSHLINSRRQWLSVLMHEMGHLIGLEHSEDPRDVMYPHSTAPYPVNF